MKFVTPYIAKYGNSKNVIKGNCGFGLENLTLDKTGSYLQSVYVKFFDIDESCINNICTTTYTRGCRMESRCNGSSDC
ncbi:hypothetical protein bsdcttw_13860 [Anaerocolumna chitinilytica]|uniref:Uncharacterized protein n=1 Tax=Anaerocolumna chitinilytica TaxID=1727145 RepID=A0A7I8DMU9_9FIRM|nr:hypothetical protein bsdcttw_13860 [Anaerocolumna chitinilytica]